MALLLGEASTLGELPDALLERVLARLERRAFGFVRLLLREQAVLARATVADPMQQPLDPCLRGGGLGARLARLTAQLGDLMVRRVLALAEGGEGGLLAGRVNLARLFVVRELLDPRLELGELHGLTTEPLLEDLELALSRRETQLELLPALGRVLDLRDQGADAVVRREGGAGGFLRPVLDP